MVAQARMAFASKSDAKTRQFLQQTRPPQCEFSYSSRRVCAGQQRLRFCVMIVIHVYSVYIHMQTTLSYISVDVYIFVYSTYLSSSTPLGTNPIDRVSRFDQKNVTCIPPMMFSSQVSCQTTLLTRPILAKVTRVRLLPCVRSHMCCQSTLHTPPILAKVTRVRLHPSVRS